MARYKNEPSDVQLNPAVFAGIQATIRLYTPDYLAKLGMVSRVTIYKYLAGEAVNPGHEELIFLSLRAAAELAGMKEKKVLAFAKSLIEQEGEPVTI